MEPGIPICGSIWCCYGVIAGSMYLILVMGLTASGCGLPTCGLELACLSCILAACDTDRSDLACLGYISFIWDCKKLTTAVFL